LSCLRRALPVQKQLLTQRCAGMMRAYRM